MSIVKLLEKRNITKYRLAQISQIPYATINDICNEKTQIDRCSAGTIYRLANALNVSMEELLEAAMKKQPVEEHRTAFDWFKSEVCHQLDRKGDIGLIKELLITNIIRDYYNKHWYKESLYLLAMLDYLCRIHHLPLCSKFNDLRAKKLSQPVFPMGVMIAADITHDERWKTDSIRDAIPEFLHFNIVEGEVRDVT